MIQPRWRENGALNKKYSVTLIGRPSVLQLMPSRQMRMLNIITIAAVIHSCAKTNVQTLWQKQTPHHQGETFTTVVHARKVGKNCATTKTPSQMKIGPQMLKAQPAGVTSV